MLEHILIADTNLFFECRRLEELPWSDIDGDPLVIVLTKPVIGEIDTHKRGSGRTRKRASEIFKRIRKMLEAEQAEVVVREEGPRVILRLAPLVHPDAQFKELLDYTQNDDRIVGMASALLKSGKYASVVMLTHDSAAAATAASIGVPFRLIAEDWLRPPEETTEVKKIRELTRDLETYRSQEPRIEVRLIEGDETTTQVVRRVPRALAREDVDRLIGPLQVRHPMQTDFTVPASQTLADGTEISYEAPPSGAVETYTTSAYPEWVARCRAILEALHEQHIEREPVVRLQIGIANTGTRPASKVRVSFEALGKVGLIRRSDESQDEDDDEGGSDTSPPARFPSPPVAPRPRRVVKPPPAKAAGIGTMRENLSAASFRQSELVRSALPAYVRDLNNLSSLARSATGMDDLLGVRRQWEEERPIIHSINPLDYSSLVLPKHDPESFYYEGWKRDVPVARGALTCDLFRHRGAEEIFEVEVVFPPNGDARGVVECTVHAENLTEPATLHVRLSRTIESYDLIDVAEAMVAASD